jgi:F-box and WD-40 domain protein CDC4
LLFSINSQVAAVTCLTCDDNHIVSGSDDGVKLWDLKTGKLVDQLCSGIVAAWNVAIDGTRIVACVMRGSETVMEVRLQPLNFRILTEILT